MTKISDVTAFVFEHPDYWHELLAGSDYPDGLSDAEREALDAAREHVERQVTDLLHECGDKLPSVVTTFTKRKFKRASTAKNRSIQLDPPAGMTGKLYSVEFGLDVADDGATVRLFASVVVKKGYLQTLLTNLNNSGTDHQVDGYHVYVPGMVMVKDAEFSSLADEAVRAMTKLVEAVQ
jgi:hypothetical protein